MNDEVSVAELLEREGWTEAERAPRRRLRVIAVMLAVVMGCGVAAVLVHIGSRDPQADAPPLFDAPHGPPGGLAGGGVPSNPSQTEVTDSDTSVVVTNQAGPVAAGVPWTSKRSTPKTSTVTVTEPRVTPTPERTPETTTTTDSGPAGGNQPSTTENTSTTTTRNTCIFIIRWC